MTSARHPGKQQPATKVKRAIRPVAKPRIALALAGGGPLGAIYEIGALCALDESLQGLSLTKLHHYVGVSAGGFIAAGLANGMTPRELCAAFIENDHQASEVFDPAWLMVPAYGEFLRRSIMLPGLAATALWRATVGRKPLLNALEKLGPALPTGVFSNEEVDRRLALLFSKAGRTNDFRKLKTRLTLVATNLDSGDAAPFGQPGWDHVPISRAVQASSALPGLFPPVEIDNHYYVDGALKKTLHAGVAMDGGIDLMLCLNPLVPFDATRAPDLSMAQRVMRRGLPKERQAIPRIIDGGLPAVLSRTTATPSCSWPTPSVMPSAASWPNTPTRRPATCCARAKPHCRPSSHGTASRSTSKCSRTHGAIWSANALPPPAWAARSIHWKKSWRT